MTTHHAGAGNDPGTTPVLFLVDADPHALEAAATALSRRFGADYQVRTAVSADEAIEALKQLAGHGNDIALIAADLALPAPGGIEFLQRAHALHPRSGRALLITRDRRGTRIPFGALESLRRAAALNQIDFSIVKGWISPEETLYPQIQDWLTAWTKLNRPHTEVMRIVGEQWAQRSHELRDALSRNTVPFGFYPANSEEGRRLLAEHAVDVERLPAVILHDGSVLHDPTLVEVAKALGVKTRPDSGVYDLTIIGAGPAGLAAAVYGASEGLRTLVVEPRSIGGQAGMSSMIRNYLGFPRGVSGGDLTFRAWEQALLFGAEFVFMQGAVGLEAREDLHEIALSAGDTVSGRAVIVAAGVEYRRLGIPSLYRLMGVGVFYGAAGVEAHALAGESVCVVGGANAAGQAALHLAKFARRVSLLVRGDSLGASMSDYLVTQIESTSNIEVQLRTRVIDGMGEHRLEGLVLEDCDSGQREEVRAAALFVMIGAEARTQWLPEAILRDEHGYVLTGHDLGSEGRRTDRSPLAYETSVPGVFAVGDVRHGSIKRVAEAVGEGSVAVGSVHQYLRLVQ